MADDQVASDAETESQTPSPPESARRGKRQSTVSRICFPVDFQRISRPALTLWHEITTYNNNSEIVGFEKLRISRAIP